MSDTPESIVLCEGFDDRAFWKGMLLSVGCVEAHGANKVHTFKASYVYRTPEGGVLLVIPCGEQRDGRQTLDRRRDPVRRMAQLLLRARATKPLARLVLNVDIDTSTPADVLQSIRALVGDDAREVSSGDFELDGGQTVVSPLLWHIPDPVAAGVPSQQALERLVCAALCAAFPKRGQAVQDWLASRPDPRGKEHKAHAWSFMAGWHTDHGMGDFYSSLWREPEVERHLRAVLASTGAWAAVERLVGIRPTSYQHLLRDDGL
jgi:hypothetical protein